MIDPNTAIRDALQPGSSAMMITDFVVVYESIREDGKPSMGFFLSENMAHHRALGMVASVKGRIEALDAADWCYEEDWDD